MMKSKEKETSVLTMKNIFRSKDAIRLAAGIFLALAFTGPAFAQYGGPGMGSGTPSYGSGKAIGIGVGAAAGGAAVLYLALHHAGTMTGCVQSGDDGLKIVDAKNKSYRIVAGGAALVPGQRVELRGKKSQTGAAGASFQPTKLVKNLGSCGTSSAAVSSLSSSPSASAPTMSAHDFPQR